MSFSALQIGWVPQSEGGTVAFAALGLSAVRFVVTGIAELNGAPGG